MIFSLICKYNEKVKNNNMLSPIFKYSIKTQDRVIQQAPPIAERCLLCRAMLFRYFRFALKNSAIFSKR